MFHIHCIGLWMAPPGSNLIPCLHQLAKTGTSELQLLYECLWAWLSVGVCMFSSNSAFVWNRFYFATPSGTVCLSRELPALFLNLTITQCQHLPSWHSSPPLSHFFPPWSLEMGWRNTLGSIYMLNLISSLACLIFVVFFSLKFDDHCQM